MDEDLALFVAASDRQSLILDALAFEIGASYQFTLEANSGNAGEEALSASHRLVKFNYDAPIVSVFSNIMLPLGPLTVNQK